ncbi:hypothetical protein [Methanobrevibacter cuticularis]
MFGFPYYKVYFKPEHDIPATAHTRAFPYYKVYFKLEDIMP